jgi:hypothetical protein
VISRNCCALRTVVAGRSVVDSRILDLVAGGREPCEWAEFARVGCPQGNGLAVLLSSHRHGIAGINQDSSEHGSQWSYWLAKWRMSRDA